MSTHGLVSAVLLAQGLTLIVLHGLKHTLSILALAVLRLLLLLLLRLLLVLLLLAVLLLLLLILLVLLLLLLILLLLLVLLILLVLLLLILLLILLLLLLLHQAASIGQVITSVLVLGVELQGFLIAVDGLLQPFHLLRLLGCLQVTVALIVQGLSSLFLGDILTAEGLLIVAGSLSILLLPIERVGQVVLSTKVGRVPFESPAVGYLCIVIALLVVGTVALAQLMTAGLGRCREAKNE